MTRAIGDDMPAQVAAEQRQIAEDIEYLVPRRLIGETRLVLNRPTLPEDQEVRDRRSRAKPLAAQRKRLLIGDECSARRDLGHDA